MTNEDEDNDGNEDEPGDFQSFNPTDLQNNILKKLIGIKSNKKETGKKEALKDHQLTRLSPIESKLPKEQKPDSVGGIINPNIGSQQDNIDTGDRIQSWRDISEKPKDIKNTKAGSERSNKLTVIDKSKILIWMNLVLV